MASPQHITIKLLNFRCHRLRIFHIPVGSVSLLTGESGSGKTTVFMSILWCLYGGLRGDALKPLKSTKSNQKSKLSPHEESKIIEEFREFGAGPSATAVSVLFPDLALIVRRAAATSALIVKLSDSTILKGDASTNWVIKTFGSRAVWGCGGYLAQNSQNPLLTSSSADRYQILYDMTFGDVTDTDASPDTFIKKITDALVVARSATRSASSEMAAARDHLDSVSREFCEDALQISPDLPQSVEECEEQSKFHFNKASLILSNLNEITEKTAKLVSLNTMCVSKKQDYNVREKSCHNAMTHLDSINLQLGESIDVNYQEQYESAISNVSRIKSQLVLMNETKTKFEDISQKLSNYQSELKRLNIETKSNATIDIMFPQLSKLKILKDANDILQKISSLHDDDEIAMVTCAIANINAYHSIGSELWNELKQLYETTNLDKLLFSDISRLIQSLMAHNHLTSKQEFSDLIVEEGASINEILVAAALRKAILESGVERIQIDQSILTMNSTFLIGSSQRSVKIIGKKLASSHDGDSCDEEDCQLFDDLISQGIITQNILSNSSQIISILNSPAISPHLIINPLTIDPNRVIQDLGILMEALEILKLGNTELTMTSASEQICNINAIFQKYKDLCDKIVLCNYQLSTLSSSSEVNSGTISAIQESYNDALKILDNAKMDFEKFQHQSNQKLIAEEKVSHIKSELVKSSAEISEIENAISKLNSQIQMGLVLTPDAKSANDQREYHLDMYKKISLQKNSIQSNNIIQRAKTRLDQASKILAIASNRETVAETALSGVVEGAICAIQKTCDSIATATNSVLADIFDNPIEVCLTIEKGGRAGIATAGHRVVFTIKYRNSEYDGASLLSGGESDRISFALTIASSFAGTSRVFLIDEALASLGETMRERVIESARKFMINKTVINVCHGVPFGTYDQIITVD